MGVVRSVRRFAVISAVFALSCSGTEGAPGTALEAPEPAVAAATPRAQVEKDLVLTLRRTQAEPFERERDPRFEVVLANRSADRTYPIVMSSDGSESGWREPHVWYTLDKRVAGGPWTAAPPEPLARCGNYDSDWTKDVTALAPGKEVTLPWFDFFEQWDLEGATAVRVVAHYAYGDHAKDLRKVPPALHAMPAYALASNAIELPVEQPLVLEVRVKGSFPAPGERLAPAIEVVCENKSTRALPFAGADAGGSLELEVEAVAADGSVDRYTLETGVGVSDARETIAPGERKSAIGPQTRTLTSSELPAGARVRRVRARLVVWSGAEPHHTDQRVARSAWVDL